MSVARLLVIAPFPLDHAGGAATVVEALVRGYRANGAHVLVAARRGGDIDLPARATWPALAQWHDVALRGPAEWIIDLARRERIDALHVHNFAGGLSAAALGTVARALGRPVVVTLHDHYALCHRGGFVRADRTICAGPGWRCLICPGRPGYRQLHRPGRRAAIRRHLRPLIVVSPSADGRDVLEANGYRDVVTIANGVDLELFAPAPDHGAARRVSDGLRLVAAGRASAVKGVSVAAAAMVEATRSGLSLRLDWYGDRAPEAAARLGNVFVGHDPVSPAELAAIYRAADLVLVPSLARETFGLAAAEALAAGKPVIASAVGALPEVIGDAGVLVAPGDAVALASAIQTLAADPLARARLGERARERACNNFAWSDAVQRYLRLFAGA